jgi:thiol-disulfide isomerase/thioredoxin
MRTFLGRVCLGLALAGACTAAADVSENADAAWAHIERHVGQPRQVLGPGISRRAVYAAREEHSLRLRELGREFYRQHPLDPRRWRAVMLMLRERPNFILSYGPEIERKPEINLDMAAQAAWRNELDAMRTALLQAPDATDAMRERVEIDWLVEQMEDARWANDTDSAAVASLQAKAEDCFRRMPAHPALKNVADILLLLTREKNPAGSTALERDLLESGSEVVRSHVRGLAERKRVREAPMELAFTAVDGRSFDLARWRGKVVLIDFWATWCGPCVAELPNVKKVYDAYHDKGFEVVGISLDREEDRQKFLDFVAAHGLPWPQYFDGKFWKNDISARYAISSIPAMFLIDPKGLLVSTDARGEKLEAEVRRLLGL